MFGAAQFSRSNTQASEFWKEDSISISCDSTGTRSLSTLDNDRLSRISSFCSQDRMKIITSTYRIRIKRMIHFHSRSYSSVSNM